jgi:hypothetical protein
LPAFGRCAEDMQPVADLQFLQFAEMVVEFAQSRIDIVRRRNAAIRAKTGRFREIDDLVAQDGTTPRIDLGCLVILVDQQFQIAQRPIGFGAGQRRRQVIDDHRRSPALCLSPLAGVVDDERIELR